MKRYLQDKDYTAAAQLAFELKQPGRLLAVVNKACEVGPAKAHHILTKLVGGLSEDELKLCLEYIREWNTNSRHCAVAQAMLQAMLVKHQPQVHCDLELCLQSDVCNDENRVSDILQLLLGQARAGQDLSFERSPSPILHRVGRPNPGTVLCQFPGS